MVDERRTVRSVSTTNIALGLAVFLAPFVVGPSVLLWHHWSNYIAGAIIVALELFTAGSPHERRQGALAGGYINMALGAWVFASVFIGAPAMLLFWLDVVLGAAVFAVAAVNAAIGTRTARRRAA